jgi:hypothetical protein
VDIPLIVMGDGHRGETEYRYRMGASQGRVVPWSLEEDPATVIRLRIPREKFRRGEDLSVEVIAKEAGTVLWHRSWRKAGWQDETPVVGASPFDEDGMSAGSGSKPQYYRYTH